MNTHGCFNKRWSTEFPTSCSQQSSNFEGLTSTAQESSGTIPILLFDVEDQDGSSSKSLCRMESLRLASACGDPAKKNTNCLDLKSGDYDNALLLLHGDEAADIGCTPPPPPPPAPRTPSPSRNQLSAGFHASGSVPPTASFNAMPGLMSRNETRGQIGSGASPSSIRKPPSTHVRLGDSNKKDLVGRRSLRVYPNSQPALVSPVLPPTTPSWNRRHTPMSPSSSTVDLPAHLHWLQDTYIDLWIDQEGFRAVYPTMKLVGYTKPPLIISTGPTNGNAAMGGGAKFTDMKHKAVDPNYYASKPDAGMAEFMPMKRESFVFHHATFDSPPLMRRLSVNGDETRDFLSQHANLSLKSGNGGVQVYTVNGTESKRAGHSDGDARSDGTDKLDWYFEYMVEDKKKPDGGKATNGEKILTPLRFCCAPGLLHSKQGRKVTVMQVWKKSVQPRAVAGRLELPKPPHASDSRSPSGFSPKAIKSNFRFNGGYKMAIWNINSSKRPKPSYGLLKEDDDDEDDEDEDDEDHWAPDNRRKSMSSSARRNIEVERSARSSIVSAKSRSRSLDSRTEDVMPYMIQRQIMSTEDLERLLSADRRPSPSERGLSWSSGQWSPGQWSLLEQETRALITPPIPPNTQT